MCNTMVDVEEERKYFLGKLKEQFNKHLSSIYKMKRTKNCELKIYSKFIKVVLLNIETFCYK